MFRIFRLSIVVTGIVAVNSVTLGFLEVKTVENFDQCFDLEAGLPFSVGNSRINYAGTQLRLPSITFKKLNEQ